MKNTTTKKNYALFVHNTIEDSYEQLTTWLTKEKALEYKNNKKYFGKETKVVFKRIE